MSATTRAVVPRYHYGELTRLRALRRRAARYVLLTDIDQFYPTIYTHTIPWALHSKATCKAAVKGGKKVLAALPGSQIDTALQALNEGQTHGIPIGPDTSLIMAEVLLAAVDSELVTRRGSLFSGFRYVDDYELAFETLSAAEDTLVELQGILASFELNLNPKKTRIVDLPVALDSPWSLDLKSISIRDKKSPTGQRNDVLALFSRAYELAAAHSSESVLRYAVSHVQRLDVHQNGWRSFHNCLLGAATADAATLAVALGTLHNVAQLGGHAIPKAPLASVFESVIARHAPRKQGSEVAWALWGALAWSIQLSATAAGHIGTMEDDVVALLALHANERGLFPAAALDTSGWATLAAHADAMLGEHWLLAYEADQKGWLQAPAVSKHPDFQGMSQAGVSFYDRSRIKPQFPVAGKALPGGTLSSYYA